MENMEASLVGSVPGTLDLHATEGAHIRVPVVPAAPRAAPVLHLHHLFVRLGDEVLDHVLLAQPVAASVSWKCASRLSCCWVTAAAPPSAATVWLRIG